MTSFSGSVQSQAIIAYNPTLQPTSNRSHIEKAIFHRNLSLISWFLQQKPELAHLYNLPDQRGITQIQRMAREGQTEIVSLFLQVLPKNEVRLNPEAYFTTSTLASCSSPTRFESLEQIPIEKFAKPITVVQNFCNTHIRMNDGSILILENTNAQSVFRSLAKRCQEKFRMEKVLSDSDILTFYISPGHAFFRIHFDSLKEDKSLGFYPEGTPLETTNSQKDVSSILFDLFTMSEPYLTLGQMLSQQRGALRQEIDYERTNNEQNHLKISLYLSPTQAKDVHDKIKEVERSCKWNPRTACRYQLFSSNCVDFAQRVFSVTGSQGHFADFFTREQLEYGYTQNLFRLYEFKAVAYAYPYSQGIGALWAGFSPGVILPVAGCISLGIVVYKIAKGFFRWASRT